MIRIDFSNTYRSVSDLALDLELPAYWFCVVELPRHRFPGLWNVCGDSNTCTTYPEGGDLCRGFGSIEVPALSVNSEGVPFFNMMPSSAELKEQLPLLRGRILGFTKFKVSYSYVNLAAAGACGVFAACR